MSPMEKYATSGGRSPSGAAPPPSSPPSTPPAPPFGDGDDRLLDEVELYALLRLPPDKQTPEAIADIPGVVVAGEPRWMKGQVLAWLAAGGAGSIRPIGKRPRSRGY